ncbi:MAG: uL13 family ribosomal protein [Candidatus Vogelbacteria bacterium]|nr:uL13 family ribosomal protein [Candidatus Vogelbacteria bacterium]
MTEIKNKKPNTFTIDAEGRTIGRVATEAAVLLAGKDSPDYARHIAGTNKVFIVNASKVKIINNKLDSIYHKHYTGNPGGMRFEMNAEIATKKGYSELLRLAVHGMLPDNKLKPIVMKNLTISE